MVLTPAPWLAAGGRAADIGCGHGAAAILLARAYPQASVHGYDFHDRSIAIARQRAAQAGLAGRIRFATADATSYPAGGPASCSARCWRPTAVPGPG